MGELMFNARSALDQLACALVPPGQLRSLLGPIRLDLATPDIGRPFYNAVTALDTLAP